MSTIPLTLIEGAVAMPRVRPLRYVPTSFGRDWALLPPARNWRAELKALYAAVLHTFCLTDQAILSFCKWVPLDERRAATGRADLASPAPAVKRASVDTAGHDVNARVADEQSVRSTTIAAPVYRQPNQRAMRLSAVAGSACSIGGVAVLAWVAFGHREHLHPPSNLKPADVAIVSPDSEQVTRPVTKAAATTQPHMGGASGKARSATSARGEVNSAVASGAVVTAASKSKDVSLDKSISSRNGTTTFDERSPGPLTTARRGIEPEVSANHALPRVLAARQDRSRIAVPYVAQPKPPAPAIAGDYSPFAPAELGVDGYASVTTSAATHLRDIAPSSNADMSNPVDTAGTEWMARMSQRRVTEVPEQFSK
jgi:hypothetical protein